MTNGREFIVMPSLRSIHLCLFAGLSWVLPLLAGDLTPPAGPPTSTMKTLDEIEPRIPIDPEGLADITIDQPGHYFLTKPADVTNQLLIDSTGVILDLNGLSHRFGGGIDITENSSGAEVVVRNGTLVDNTVIEVVGTIAVAVEGVTFEAGGRIESYNGSYLSIRDCRFMGAGGFAIQIQSTDIDVLIDRCHFQDFSEAIILSDTGSRDSIQIKDSIFIGNSQAILVEGFGTLDLLDCLFDGGSNLNSKGIRAFHIMGDITFRMHRSTAKNFDWIFDIDAQGARLLAANCQFELFQSVLDHDGLDEYGSVEFNDSHFIGDSSSNLFADGSGSLAASFSRSVFNGFDNLANTSAPVDLSFDSCQFENFSQYEWPADTQVRSSTINVDGAYEFIINDRSLFSETRIEAKNDVGLSQRIQCYSGVVIDRCNLVGIRYGLQAMDSSVVIRSSLIQRGDRYSQSGEAAIYNSDPSGYRDAMLIDDSVVSGYSVALEDNNFQLRAVTIRDCGVAFSNLNNLQLSDSSIFVENLGEVQAVAVMSNSTLRTSNVGLWVGQVQARDCSFSNQDIGSDAALTIGGYDGSSGSIQSCSFSSFSVGIDLHTSSAISIAESSFGQCTIAIDADSSSGSVITRNTVVSCSTGILGGFDAVITDNTISVQNTGIEGDGLIVRNQVLSQSSSPYNIGSSINPITGSDLDPENPNYVPQPWANVYE